jgi:hypothetical protein
VTSPAAPSAELLDRVARIIGRSPRRWEPVTGGYTPAARWRLDLGGSGAFLKVATNPLTAQMLRAELRAYELVTGPFMPDFLGGDDNGDAPFILIEDLTAARWPPPWDAGLVDAVLDALACVHARRAPAGLLPPPPAAPGWQAVADDPASFLKLGLATGPWLDLSLDTLLAAEAACPVLDAMTHFDVRSDNICLSNGRVKLVDWAEGRPGNPRLDTGFWLPSLAWEGGPAPEAILPDAPDVAAWVAGYFAARAGLPDIADATRVRQIQRAQLAMALPWAVRALRLLPL